MSILVLRIKTFKSLLRVLIISTFCGAISNSPGPIKNKTGSVQTKCRPINLFAHLSQSINPAAKIDWANEDSRT